MKHFFDLIKDSELFFLLPNLLLIFSALFVAGHVLKRLILYYSISKAAKNLAPYFTYFNVKEARQYFIPTRFQNYSPTAEEEPRFSHKFVVKGKLINWFINTGFNEKKETEKFYLILADSGMGKTTFMINLYVQYNSFFNFKKKYKIKLLPFGDSRILEILREMTKKQDEVKDTILLLDAFDEYKGLLPPEKPDGLSDDERFRKRLDEIVELVRDFREVVITSRTQYFPGQENQPYELKISRFDDMGFHTLAKLYLSPFDGKEINKYLNNKYGWFKFWNFKRKRIAATIVKNSPKLMVRPMLLSYTDLLVDGKHTYNTSYQIYETLVEKWIDREAKKEKYSSEGREMFKLDLYSFSRLAALEIYKQRKESGGLSLKKEIALELCKANNIKLQGYQITGKSLLTRDASHNWKFAHRSLFEFFLSKQVIENKELEKYVDFDGFDMAKEFYWEQMANSNFCKYTIPFFKSNLIGTYKTGSSTEKNISNEMNIDTLKEITWLTLKGNKLNEIEGVKWLDKLEYLNLFENDIKSEIVDDLESFLLTKKGNVELAMILRHQSVALKWHKRRNKFSSDALKMQPNIYKNSTRYLPSNSWYSILKHLREDLLVFEYQTSCCNKIEYGNKALQTLSHFINETHKPQFNKWNSFYLATLDDWFVSTEDIIEEQQLNAKRIQPISSISYSPGSPLFPEKDSEKFVGRTDIILTINNEILINNRLPLFLIYGQRRIGKTSFLNFLPVLLGQRFEVIYFSLQNITSINHWFEVLYETFNMKLSIETICDIDFEYDDWSKIWHHIVKHINSNIVASEKHLVIAFDEYEKIHQYLEKERSKADNLLGAIRTFSQSQEKVSFIFVGAFLFSELINPNWASFFTDAIRIKVSYLSKEQSLKLINLLTLNFYDEIPEIIYEITHGHPNLIHLICKGIEELANTTNRSKIYENDLNQIVKEKILINENGVIDVFWIDYCQKGYRATILDILDNKQIAPNYFTSHLLTYDYIFDDGKYYKFKVPLFEKWLKENLIKKWIK